MIRLILFGTVFIILINQGQPNAARQLHGQSSGRIRSSTRNVNPLESRVNSAKEYSQELYKLSRYREKSPTFIQSRRFHFDQLARDIRDLDHLLSFTAPMSSSYYYSYGGPGTHLAISSQEACRLTNTFCSSDYQCCSGKCRCIKWSIVGKMSC
ncbi:unnamed protein product [Rotaria sp. Silwood2]|nr:unnamed protein product [Rotaria sp. Silwood2]CAF4248611.1 unnamed protein product [Rotaria sp. Silwood2]